MSSINYNNIPVSAFVVKSRGIIKYVPEIAVQYEVFNDALWKTKFPYYANVNYKVLQLTNVGVYSIASPENSKNLLKILSELNTLYKFVDNYVNLVVTDATGGVGGFAIRLAKTFTKINVVEINNTHADIIKHNLHTYHIDVEDIVHNVDYLDIMHMLQQHIIVFDLPWYGPKYKLEKDIQLSLSNINIWHIINELYKANKFKACVILVPKNFNFQDFIINITSPNIIIKKTNNHFYIIVINLQ